MSCMDNKDGSCSVEYIPYEAGTYSLNVTYGGHQVPGEVVTVGQGYDCLITPTLTYEAAIPLTQSQVVPSRFLCMM